MKIYILGRDEEVARRMAKAGSAKQELLARMAKKEADARAIRVRLDFLSPLVLFLRLGYNFIWCCRRRRSGWWRR